MPSSSRPSTSTAAAATTAVASTTTAAPQIDCDDACCTRYDDTDHRPGRPCVFPFVYDGAQHTKCTRDSFKKYWCAVRVDAAGRYITDEWGVCNDHCSDQPPPPVQPAVRPCAEKELDTAADFIGSHLVPFIYSMTLLAFVVVLYAFKVYWTRLQERRLKRSQTMEQAEGLGTALARRFLPSMAIGTYRFRGMAEKTKTVSIKFEELGLALADGRTVLHGVTGEFTPGRMAAIMGPSGAGKTTFMNVLCGKATYGKMTGTVHFNNTVCDISAIKPAMGFVPQDDVVHGNLTVRENIHFSAQLRNPRGTSAETVDNIVEDVLTVMQIGHIQLSVVGTVEERGISGGQRKRVNIGLELAACPTLLFLDEPTSGLDSTSSLQIINSLKKMTELGMTIIMVIHQPRYSLFTLFDDVLLLGPGGKTVYQGPSQSAKPYFEALGFEMPADDNPADWFMDILSGGVSNPKIEHFKPAMLTDEWPQRRKSVKPTARRQLSSLEDEQVFMHAVEAEWDKIDLDGSDTLDEAELSKLLENCGCNTQQDASTLRSLFRRIAGEADYVEKQDLVDFLRSQLTTVATDKAVAADTPTAAEGGSFLATVPLLSMRSSSEQLAEPKLGCCGQFQVILTRRLVTIFRESKQRLIDVGLISGCALLAGLMHRGQMGTDRPDLPQNLHIFHLGLALLSTVSAMKIFGDEQAIFWRESASGMNIFAYTNAKIWGNLFDWILQCSVYVFIYFFLTQPPIHYRYYFVPCFLASMTGSSWGYFISTVIPPKNATLAGVIYVLIFCGIFGAPFKIAEHLDIPLTEAVLFISITRWTVPMTFVPTVDHAKESSECIDPSLRKLMADYEGGSILQYHSSHSYGHYLSDSHIGPYNCALLVLGATTALLWVLSYVGLRCMNRSKQV